LDTASDKAFENIDCMSAIHSCQVRTYGPPVCKGILKIALFSLRQRIRSRGHAPAKMEIRAARSS
jgi:hypothetical protein